MALPENREFCDHLNGLAGATQETIDAVISALWITRKTGLRPPQVSHLQSLLNLSSPSQLFPVVACLRSLIRKCVHEDYDYARVLTTFPPELSSNLTEAVASSLCKGVSRWKEELRDEKSSNTRSELPREVKTSVPSYFTSFPPGGVLGSAGTHQEDPIFGFSSRATRTPWSHNPDSVVLNPSPLPKQCQEDAATDTAPIPCVSSMTWTLEKQKGKGSKAAVVTLKLQGRSNTPTLEREVKVRLTTENVEVMLKSMVQIDEEFSNMVETLPQPLEKKQKQ